MKNPTLIIHSLHMQILLGLVDSCSLSTRGLGNCLGNQRGVGLEIQLRNKAPVYSVCGPSRACEFLGFYPGLSRPPRALMRPGLGDHEKSSLRVGVFDLDVVGWLHV